MTTKTKPTCTGSGTPAVGYSIVRMVSGATGTCPVCGTRYPLTKTGAVRKH